VISIFVEWKNRGKSCAGTVLLFELYPALSPYKAEFSVVNLVQGKCQCLLCKRLSVQL